MRFLFPTAAIFLLGAVPALAQGTMGDLCPPGSRVVYDSPTYAVCKGGTSGALTEIEGPSKARRSRTQAERGDPAARPSFVLGLQREATERRGTLFCRYPHRPSDSVFVGGSGYLIKDDVRRRQGCI